MLLFREHIAFFTVLSCIYGIMIGMISIKDAYVLRPITLYIKTQ